MRYLKLAFELGQIFIAAFAGSAFGNGIRLYRLQQEELRQRRQQGLTVQEEEVVITGVFSNGFLGTLMGLLVTRQRSLFAFATGAVLSMLLGDRLDRELLGPANLPPNQE